MKFKTGEDINKCVMFLRVRHYDFEEPLGGGRRAGEGLTARQCKAVEVWKRSAVR
jgi:hypothetical protein